MSPLNSPYPPAVVAALTLLVVGVFTAKTLQDPAGSFLLWGGLCLGAVVAGGITYAIVWLAERRWKFRTSFQAAIRVVPFLWAVVVVALMFTLLAIAQTWGGK
jgi:hypothetical protein